MRVTMGEYDDWDDVYRKYPHRPEYLPWELGKPRESLVKLVEEGNVNPGSALDVCCGLGTNTMYLAQQGFETTGMDISASAIGDARKRAADAGVDVCFCVGNTLNLPFNDGHFDLVTDFGCFHHIEPEDREAYIKGIHRVLKVGGRYFLFCFSRRMSPAWNHFSREDIHGLFSPFFDILEMEDISSVEGDGVTREFLGTLMEKPGRRVK